MKWKRQLVGVGPHPFRLARSAWFVAGRHRSRRGLQRLYSASPSLPDAQVRWPDVDLPTAEKLPASARAACARIRREADAILEHRADFLGSGLVPLGEQIDWHCDFKSGYRWPLAPYDRVEATCLTDDRDPKVPWELSRGHQLLTLARAAVLFDDERYAGELEAQLDDWLKANPPGQGINWTTAMEVALRAVNWLWSIGTLQAFSPLDSELAARITRSLQLHGRHVMANLEGTPYLRSNHYIGDLLGLLALGVTVEGDPDAAGWLRFARRELEREVLEQVYPDGVSFEGSLPYHGLVLEMLILARHLANWAGQPLSPRFDERVCRMLEVSRSVRHPDGRSPVIGDQDSGRVLPAGFDRPPTHDHMLWIGAAVFGAPAPLSGEPSAEVLLTLGLGAWKQLGLRPKATAMPLQNSFPDAGVYVLRGEGTHLVARCGGVGTRGLGGHAHNDLFSYELSYGSPLVVDSGAYVYTADVDARNAFRSTAAHNVVRLDGEELNPYRPEEIFMLRQVADPVVEHFGETAQEARLVVRHDGYKRLPLAVVHRRNFVLDRRTGDVSVSDELTGSGAHRAESYVHLAPGVEVTDVGGGLFKVDDGKAEVSLLFWGFEGGVRVTDGWVSSSYGARQRAPVLVGTLDGELPASFGYRFVRSSPSADAESANTGRLDQRERRVEAR